jgi:probable HAF family extracellular repeat protein
MVTGKTIRIGIIAIFLATSPALAANPVYHIVDLGELNAAGLNASGEVTGTAQGVEYAFLYNGTTVQNLGTLGGDDSFGYAINDSGEVTGASHTTGNGALDAFLYNGTTMLDLGRFGQDESFGYGINASGEVTGASDTPSGSVHAFLYNGTRMLDLGTLGGFESAGYAINAHGTVTGFSYTNPINNGPGHAFLYNGTTMLDLGALDGDTFGVGLAITTAARWWALADPRGSPQANPPTTLSSTTTA